MKKFLSIALLSAVVATPALAADNTGKFYVGAAYNAYTQNISGYSNPSGFAINGGYNISNNLAAEIGYDIISASTSTAAKNTHKSMQVAAVGTYSVANAIDLVGKLGFASSGFDNKPDTGATFAKSNNSLMYGLGAQYNANKQVNVRIMYENLGVTAKKDTELPAGDATLSKISIGANYAF